VLRSDAVSAGEDIFKCIAARSIRLHHPIGILIDAVQRNLRIRYFGARIILSGPSNAPKRGLCFQTGSAHEEQPEQ
jgi:hypothetical protein